MSGKCSTCHKTVYTMDPQIVLDGSKFHKECAKCAVSIKPEIKRNKKGNNGFGLSVKIFYRF